MVQPRSPCVAGHNTGQSRSCWVGQSWPLVLVCVSLAILAQGACSAPTLFVCLCHLAIFACLLPIPPTLVGGTKLVGPLGPAGMSQSVGRVTGEMPGCVKYWSKHVAQHNWTSFQRNFLVSCFLEILFFLQGNKIFNNKKPQNKKVDQLLNTKRATPGPENNSTACVCIYTYICIYIYMRCRVNNLATC